MDATLIVALSGLGLALRKDVWEGISAIFNIQHKVSNETRHITEIQKWVETEFKHLEQMRLLRTRVIDDQINKLEQRVQQMHLDASDRADELQKMLGSIHESTVKLQERFEFLSREIDGRKAFMPRTLGESRHDVT